MSVTVPSRFGLALPECLRRGSHAPMKTICQLLVVSTALVVSACSTDYQRWEGPPIVRDGTGGTRKNIHGMDVWMNGTPPTRYRVLGFIQTDETIDRGCIKKAHREGADALILISRRSDLAGIVGSSSASVTAYGNMATGYGSSFSAPVYRTSQLLAVIKYVK
jgi:hypothetical protein